MRKYVTIAAVMAIFMQIARNVVNVHGSHEDPNGEFGRGVNYQLAGDTKFGWKTSRITGDINLNGHSLFMETGGGNATAFSGRISGDGTVIWSGGGVPQVGPSILNGSAANDFHGSFILTRGVLDLSKPPGTIAIPGDLNIGTDGVAAVRFSGVNELAATSSVTLGGPEVSAIYLQGNGQKMGDLVLKAHGVIDFDGSPSTLAIGDSSRAAWDLSKTLTVHNFLSGKDRLVIGTNSMGLSDMQLARIGFASPSGKPRGMYRSRIQADGSLEPSTIVRPINPPFDISPRAADKRARLYQIHGLAEVTGAQSPLSDGATAEFFGDSITWLNGYIDGIGRAIKGSPTTGKLNVRLVNHGINGGGVMQIRDGSATAGYPNNSPQKPFAEIISADKPTVAIVFIGINDVWWRKTTPNAFDNALRDIVASAAAGHVRLVLATMELHGELPDGKNADDPKIEQFADIARKVAADTGTTLVDLRKACIAFLQNNNAELRVDGSVYSKPEGVLTYDGVHPNANGVDLLANLISDGIYRALRTGQGEDVH